MNSGLVLDAAGRFVMKAWQDEAVVYDTLSGDTHVLDPFAYAVARQLASAGKADADVANAIASQFELTAEDIAELVPVAVAKLQRIGILIASQRDSR